MVMIKYSSVELSIKKGKCYSISCFIYISNIIFIGLFDLDLVVIIRI